MTLPKPNQVSGSLLTGFNLSPQSYSNKAASLYGVDPDSTLPGLFSFLASYRLSPNSWGYGNPKAASGYTSDRRWWLDKTAQMVAAAGQPSQFASMWIPISSNRWSKSTYVGGQSPFEPQTWCSYLRSVHDFWQSHGWLAGSYPYLWGMDEPGLVAVPRRPAAGESHALVLPRQPCDRDRQAERREPLPLERR